MKIPIPRSKRKRVLIVVDVQLGFVKKNKQVVLNIVTLLNQEKYDLYVEAIFHAPKGSLWDKQVRWTFPLQPTVKELAVRLKEKGAIKIVKKTKSVFKGNKNLFSILKKKKIEEVHLVGFDTSDCVLASAQEAFDLGFFTYVIEECTSSSESSADRKHALAILRHLRMTNH